MFFGQQPSWFTTLGYALLQPWSSMWYLTNVFEDYAPLSRIGKVS